MSGHLTILNDFNSLNDFKTIEIDKNEFSIVLISSTEIDLGNLINDLIDRNCNYFVCVGENAEALHDYIDHCYYEKTNYQSSSVSFMTVWLTKEKESINDIVFYFLRAAINDNFEVEYIVALFNDTDYEKELIESTTIAYERGFNSDGNINYS